MTTDRLEAALALHRAGFAIFPIADDTIAAQDERHKTNAPLVTGTPQREAPRADEAQIRRWWSKYPTANIAWVLPPDVIAFDIDVKAADGVAEFRQLCEQLGVPPTTKAARTPSGGLHLIYRYPDRQVHGNTLRSLPDGAPLHIDLVDSTKRYLAIAPSEKHGQMYRWECEEYSDGPRVGVATLPDAWERYLVNMNGKASTSRAHGAQRPDEVTEVLATFRPGEACEVVVEDLGRAELVPGARHNELVTRTMSLLHLGTEGHVGVAAAVDTLKARYLETPDSDEREFEQILAGGVAKLAEAPRADRCQCGRSRPQNHDLWLVKAHRQMCREQGIEWCPDLKKWIGWTGQRWSVERGSQASALLMEGLAEDLLGQAAEEAEVERKKFLQVVARHAAATSVQVSVVRQSAHGANWAYLAEFDRDPLLINLANGVLALHDGEVWLIPHDETRDLRLTKQSPTEWRGLDAPAPQWEAFLDRVQPDVEVREFLARLAGYTLTGLTGEQVFTIFYGPTAANGKSTFLTAVTTTLGPDYATATSVETLAVPKRGRRSGSEASPDKARLRGLRLVSAVETGRGTTLDTSFINQVTGGDPIVARHLYGDPFEFTASFKMVMATNEKPKVSDPDSEGLWRRVVMVPWPEHIPLAERVPKDRMDRALADEASGILAWLVRGYLDWYRRSGGGVRSGLDAPEAVVTLTAGYRHDIDHLSRFIDEHFTFTGNAKDTTPRVRVGELLTSWQFENPLDDDVSRITKREALARVEAKIGQPKKVQGTYVYRGVLVKEDAQAVFSRAA